MTRLDSMRTNIARVAETEQAQQRLSKRSRRRSKRSRRRRWLRMLMMEEEHAKVNLSVRARVESAECQALSIQ